MTSESNKRPKPSRMERQIRFWVAIAGGVALLLLVVIIGMTARYGYNQTSGDLLDKWSQAVTNGGMDLAGAMFAGLFGICTGLRRVWGSVVTLLLAGLCAIYTYQAIVGFQASSRETLAASRESAAGLSKQYMTWATEMVTKKIDAEKSGKAKQEAVTVGIEAIGAQVEKQIKMLQAGEIIASDGQATTFARTFRTTEADARSWVITLTAILLIAIQYASSWAYGYARQRLEPIISAQNVVGMSHFAADKTTNSTNAGAFSEDAARQDLNLLMSSGFSLDRHGAYSFLARRFGWTPHKTRRWLERQADLTVKPKRHHRRSVQNGDNLLPALNGNGRAHLA